MIAYFLQQNNNEKVFTVSLTFRPVNVGLIDIVITILTSIIILFLSICFDFYCFILPQGCLTVWLSKLYEPKI